ncbi:MAG TPA: 3-isopropylmalate dehydratase large subunit [Thermoanaerobaculia bacterium]|nr:3-isopropylmalate dehydratase large subunit [Thermoanaerobaculia bacterium]HUM28753.1 3-isopropylmalate dehydratase large subunit [Thermoanaerobaculia bacterium]HXK67997.1 3-isopropylmalate dehydratase large subunit [Thermoanaerobaculia bacterium]
MGRSFSQKILAAYSGKESVEVGEIVTVRPDHVLSHDNSSAISKTFAKIGVERVFNPGQPVIVLDHCVPAATEAYAENHKTIRDFVRRQGLQHFYDIQRGVCHQVLMEEGFARPGGLILGSDSHTTTYGAVGCFSAGIGRSEAAAIWATGEMWLRCPETFRINLEGERPPTVSAKDVALEIIGRIGADGALYQAVEFTGPGASAMSVDERMVLTNLAAEMGAKIGYVPPDEKTFLWLKDRSSNGSTPVYSDPDAPVAGELTIDLSSLTPRTARPHTVDNVCAVSEVRGIQVHQVLIGTCTNGRLYDIAEACSILKDRKIHPQIRLLVFPASSSVYREAMKLGYLDTILEAGGVIMNPGCGPCLGAHEGALAPGEVCLSTANRNFKGRMGCNTADIYLASPRTAAITAIKGVIDDEI